LPELALILDATRAPFFVFLLDASRRGEANGREGQSFAYETVAFVDELLEAFVETVEAVGETQEWREEGGV